MGSHWKFFSRVMTWTDLYHMKISLAAMVTMNGVGEARRGEAGISKSWLSSSFRGGKGNSSRSEEQWLFRVYFRDIIIWNCCRTDVAKQKGKESRMIYQSRALSNQVVGGAGFLSFARPFVHATNVEDLLCEMISKHPCSVGIYILGGDRKHRRSREK